jgi:hypothetical protein
MDLKAFQNGPFYEVFKRNGRKESIDEYCCRETHLGVSKISPPDAGFDFDSGISL